MVLGLIYPGNGDNTVLQNISKCLSIWMA